MYKASLTWVLVSVFVELLDSSQAEAREVGQGRVGAGVVITLHDVERYGTRVASHLPHRYYGTQRKQQA